MYHCRKSPDSFPLLGSPESTVIEVFLVSVVHVNLVWIRSSHSWMSVRGYDIDLTIYSLSWTSQMMFVLWWSPERFLKSSSLSCKDVLCFLSLSLLERSYSWGFPDTKSYLNLIFIIQLVVTSLKQLRTIRMDPLVFLTLGYLFIMNHDKVNVAYLPAFLLTGAFSHVRKYTLATAHIWQKDIYPIAIRLSYKNGKII